jgi:hypothetical protein
VIDSSRPLSLSRQPHAKFVAESENRIDRSSRLKVRQRHSGKGREILQQEAADEIGIDVQLSIMHFDRTEFLGFVCFGVHDLIKHTPLPTVTHLPPDAAGLNREFNHHTGSPGMSVEAQF